MKNFFKHRLKSSNYILDLFVYVIALYLRIVYFTSRLEYTMLGNQALLDLRHSKNSIFAFWHNQLVLALGGLNSFHNLHALASSHSDGKIVAKTIIRFGHSVIAGSTNKGAIGAARSIMKKLSENHNIVITPDGPRGPIYQVNSNITKIAFKCNSRIFPVYCRCYSFFKLKSWDGMIIPKPFGTIQVIIGAEIKLSGDETRDQNLLQNELNLINKTI